MAFTMLFSIASTQGASAKNLMHKAPRLNKHKHPPTVDKDQVLLRRTSHGVVHVKASGYTGIGYGVGYAYTEDNRCLLSHRIAEVNGRLSEQLGADAPVTSDMHDLTYTALQSDHYYKGWFNIEKIYAGFEKGASEVRELANGYAAGVNKFLGDHPDLASCPVKFKGDVTVEDIYRMWVATASVASGEVVAGMLPHSAPANTAIGLKSNSIKNKSAEKKVIAASSIKPLSSKLTSVGSNAWAIGREGTKKGNSVHLYNPHFPWEGIQRQYMIHITFQVS